MGVLMQATGYLWPKDGLAVCGVKPSSVWNRIFRFILSCSNPQKGTHAINYYSGMLLFYAFEVLY